MASNLVVDVLVTVVTACAWLGTAKNDIFAVEQALISYKEVLRTGFTRLKIPYFMQDAEVDLSSM